MADIRLGLSAKITEEDGRIPCEFRGLIPQGNVPRLGLGGVADAFLLVDGADRTDAQHPATKLLIVADAATVGRCDGEEDAGACG